MKRFILAGAVLALCGATADAGPIRCIAANVKERVEARAEQVKERIQARPHVRQFGSDLRAVAAIPSKIAEARPLSTFLRAVSCGPWGCK